MKKLLRHTRKKIISMVAKQEKILKIKLIIYFKIKVIIFKIIPIQVSNQLFGSKKLNAIVSLF